MAEKTEMEGVRSGRSVRVTIPAAIAYDLGAFQKSLADLLGHLGCMACCSGFDITFLQERQFFINEKLEIRSTAGLVSSNPMPGVALPMDPIPYHGVSVTLPPKVSY